MRGEKKKSSGWRPVDKRGSFEERHGQHVAARATQERRDNDRLGLWRRCQVRQCRRLQSCTGEPQQCRARGRQTPPQLRPTAALRSEHAPERAMGRAEEVRASAKSAPAAPSTASAPVLPAAEAAAAIAAALAAMPLERSFGEELDIALRGDRRR